MHLTMVLSSLVLCIKAGYIYFTEIQIVWILLLSFCYYEYTINMHTQFVDEASTCSYVISLDYVVRAMFCMYIVFGIGYIMR